MAPPIAILTSVHGARDGEALLLDTKAMEGIDLYARLWPGPVIWMLAMQDRPASYASRCDAADLPFTVIEVATDRSDVATKLPADAVLVASIDSYNDLDLAPDLANKVVYIIEYTLRTRLDIIRASSLPWYRALRSMVWEWTTERRRRKAIRAAAGLQCNGLPSFDAYRTLAANPILFFDTRLAEADQISAPDLAAKQERVKSGVPLHLAFSGRLNRMKGVHHIPPLLDALDGLGVNYVFDVFGEGELTDVLRAKASSKLVLHGSVAFPDAWVPAMQAIDLFVCPHLQGDPSCTYLEMLGCGVPIAGFANEAWDALSKRADLGSAVPIGDVQALAAAIGALDRDRDRLAALMAEAAAFSASRSMERTFGGRLDHLKAIAST